MHAAIKLLQDPPYPVEQYSTRCDAEDAPVVTEVHPPVIDGTPANNSNSNNNVKRTPTVAPHAWHHTVMSAATFALSAIMGYIATEAICKRIRDRN